MTKKTENVINSYERKILRRILGPINDNGTHRPDDGGNTYL
jgi:hypothetical protein